MATSPYDPDDHDDSLISPVPAAPAPLVFPQPRAIQNYATPAAPATSTVPQADPAPVTPQYQPPAQPSAPKGQSFPAPLAQAPAPAAQPQPEAHIPGLPEKEAVIPGLETASSPSRPAPRADTAAASRPPKVREIPGLEGFDGGNIEEQNDHVQGTMAPGQPRLPTYVHQQDEGETTPPNSSQAQTQQSKPYSIGTDKQVQFDLSNPTRSILTALQDGVIDQNTARQSLAAASRVQTTQNDLAKLAGEHPELKALGEGLTTGGAFLAGGAAAAGAGNLGLNESLGAASGPFALATMSVANAVEFLGGGMLAAWAKKKLETKLADYSDAVKSLQASAQLHPNYEMVGELLPQLPAAVSSVRGLVKMGQVAADSLGVSATAAQRTTAAVKVIGTKVGAGAAGGAAVEGVVRPAVDYAADKTADALGIEHAESQAPTWESLGQNAALGGLLAGHGITMHDYAPPEVQAIIARGRKVEAAGLPIADALNPHEAEVYKVATAKIAEQLKTTGTEPSISVRQAIQSGQPVGVAAARVNTAEESTSSASRRGLASTPTSGQQPDRAPADPALAAPFAPGSSEPPSALSTTSTPRQLEPDQFDSKGTRSQPSPSATNPPATGQAQPAAPPEPTPFHEALPAIRDAVRAKIRDLRAAGKPLTPELGQLSAASAGDIKPQYEQRFLELAAKADAQHDLGLSRQGIVLPGAEPPIEQAAPRENSARDDAPVAPSAPAKLADTGSEPADATSDEAHEALAAKVNADETYQGADRAQSVTHQMLTRLKARGVEINGDLARALGERVGEIVGGHGSEEDMQAGLRALYREHRPADALGPAHGNETDFAKPASVLKPHPSSFHSSPTTFDGIVGEKIDAKRTAFHADSGTLGIPREQMPQVAAEHRGAMAQWLQARGMSFSPEEVLPGSLKPSQADFNPAKVEKAAKWAPGSDRRIMVSADNHVIDGHHQWMGKLQAEPDKPMQVLRVNAPARDILSQLHEFPSAGMEKAPDLAPRIEAPTRPGDRPAQREAMNWIADQRQQGRDHRELTDEVSQRFGVSRDAAWTLVARQAAAEQMEAAGRQVVGSSPSRPQEKSAFSKPVPREPNTEPGKQAQRALDRLTAKRDAQNGFLDAEDTRVLGNAREVIDKDLNRQALGPNPQPTTAAGKSAQRGAQKFADADAAGARLPASDHAAWKNHRSVMENDFTAQRKAIEAKSTSSRQSETPSAPPLKRGDAVTYKGRRATVEQIEDGKATVRVHAGQDPKTGANLINKRVRDVPLDRVEKLAKPGSATQLGETSASPRARTALNALGKLRAIEEGGQRLSPTQVESANRFRADLASEGVSAREQPPMLKGEAVGRIQQALRSDPELLEVAKSFGLGGIEAADLGGKESSGIAYRGGKILVDSEGLTDSLSGKTEAKAHEWLRQAIGEEIVHHATLRIPDAQARMESIAQDPASRDLHDFTAKNYAGWDKLDDFQKGAEMVRTAVQKNWRGTITEKVFSAIRDLLSHLHDVLRRIPENSLLKQTVADVESVLREAGARIRGEATGTPAEGSSTPAKASDAFTAKAGGRVTYGRRAATVQNIEGDTATILVKGTKQPVKVALADLKAPVSRRFVLPGHPTGQPDIIDHIAEAGGMRGSVKGERIARAKGIDTGADYDDRPDLKGVYQNAVFGGNMTPDQMAQHLAEGAPDENGTPTQATFGDGTVGKMYGLIDEAMRGRASAKTELARRATSEQQTDRFQKEALSPGTAKGETQVYARELSPGDKVQIGNQTLKVVAVDPDGVTLEDHTRFGVQHVDEGDKLYVEKVESAQAGDGTTLAAARPRDTGTGHLFGDDEPFDLRGEAAPLLERIAAAKQRAQSPPADNLPTLRRGENQGDLLSRQSEDLHLVGERGIDHGVRQAAQEQAEREAAEAKAKQDREQQALFAAKPGEEQTPDPTRAGSIRELVDETMGTDAPARRRFVQYDTVTPEQAAKLKASTGLDLDGYRRNIDNNAVRHVLKNHGDPAQEISRGNAPLYKEDFERLPELLAQPDASIYGGQNRYGQDIILSAKRVNGYYVVAEEVRDGKRTLNLQTLYKKSAPPLADDAGQGPTPPLTPEAVQSAAQRILHQVVSQHNFLHGDGNDTTLAAAKPETIMADEPHPAAPAPSAGFGARLKEKVSDVTDQVAATREQAAREDRIAALHDAVPTRAGIAGRRAANAVRLDLEQPLDRRAATALVEAGGNRSRLEADLAKVKGSADPKLAAEYAPVYQHAIDNLPRLAGSLDRYRRIGVNEANAAQQAGIEGTPWQPYVQHVLDDPDLGQSVANEHGLGAVGKFRTYADAIAAGADPKSMDLADVAERQVRQNRQAINEGEFRATLAGLNASDGKPVLSSIAESTTRLNADGSVSASSKVPKGYEAVQAGQNVLTVHKDFAPILKALYGESAIRQSKLGQAALDLAALAKHGTAMLDSYHAFRVLAKEALGFQTLGYDKGLAALDYAPEDLKDAVKAGRISQQDDDFAKAHADTVERGLKAGLNVGRISDNLLEAARQHGLIERLPVVGKGLAKVNELIFGKLTRGAMVQAFTVAEARNRERFSDLSADEVARKSAKEVNEVFGNLGSQGVFKSKTMQDAMKLLLFAPNWSESQLRSEGRAFVQAGKAAKDFVTGKGFRPGVVAQAMATTLFAALASNQALNLVTRGKLTFHNPEDDHKWDAFIPGPTGSPGFFFSPLSIAAEYSHAMMKYMQGGESFLDAAAHVGSNKLSGPARGVKDLVTGEDWKGQKFGSTGERLKAAAIDTLPSPMPASGFLEKDPKSPVGYGWNHQPGSLEKQALGMVGLKVDNAASAKAQVYRLADAFRAKHGGGTGGGDVQGAHGPSAYADLRGLLERNDLKGASGEVRRLVREQGKDLAHIRYALGIKTDGTIQAKHFSGSAKTEKAFVDSLTLEQRKVYFQAQKEHAQVAQRLRGMVGAGTVSASVGS